MSAKSSSISIADHNVCMYYEFPFFLGRDVAQTRHDFQRTVLFDLQISPAFIVA